VDIGAFEFGSEFENLVASRYIFYNNSWYDGQSSAINELDRLAIDPTKHALLPDGSLAGAANITSYSRGINGIMIDLAGSHPDISADDFIFRVGATNDPASWAAAPAPSAIQVLAGQGVGGADRIVITWPDGAILNTYLQVIVAANEDTGLAEPDVFFFGNRVGEGFSTQPPAAFVTSAADELAARNATPKLNLDVANPFDFDKNRTITAADMLIARNNAGFLPRIQIAPPAEASPLAATRPGTVALGSDFSIAQADANAVVAPIVRDDNPGSRLDGEPTPVCSEREVAPTAPGRSGRLDALGRTERFAREPYWRRRPAERWAITAGRSHPGTGLSELAQRWLSRAEEGSSANEQSLGRIASPEALCSSLRQLRRGVTACCDAASRGASHQGSQ